MRKARNDRQRALALAYQRTFFGEGNAPHVNAEAVLEDLRKQACMDQPTIVVSKQSGMVDSHATAYRAAIRDVYARITGMLGIDPNTQFTTSEDPHHEPTDAQS